LIALHLLGCAGAHPDSAGSSCEPALPDTASTCDDAYTGPNFVCDGCGGTFVCTDNGGWDHKARIYCYCINDQGGWDTDRDGCAEGK
jgi:hypothetical protein